MKHNDFTGWVRIRNIKSYNSWHSPPECNITDTNSNMSEPEDVIKEMHDLVTVSQEPLLSGLFFQPVCMFLVLPYTYETLHEVENWYAVTTGSSIYRCNGSYGRRRGKNSSNKERSKELTWLMEAARILACYYCMGKQLWAFLLCGEVMEAHTQEETSMSSNAGARGKSR